MRGAAREGSHTQPWYRIWQLEDIHVAVWLNEAQGAKAKTQTEPAGPNHTSWFGKAWVPAATQAGHPVVPQASQQANQVCWGNKQPGQFREVAPLNFREPAPTSLVNHPLATVAGGWGQKEVRRLLSPPNARGCVCSPQCPPPPPCLESPASHTAGGSSVGRKQKGSHSHIPCKAAPVSHRPCHLLPC